MWGRSLDFKPKWIWHWGRGGREIIPPGRRTSRLEKKMAYPKKRGWKIPTRQGVLCMGIVFRGGTEGNYPRRFPACRFAYPWPGLPMKINCGSMGFRGFLFVAALSCGASPQAAGGGGGPGMGGFRRITTNLASKVLANSK